MNNKVLFGLALAFVLGGIVTSLFDADPTRAQTVPRIPAIASGPGGMWIVAGNHVVVCQQGIMAGARPAAPVCGPATEIP